MLTDRLATLSHRQRMAVFRLLMRRCPDELPAGEISDVLALKPSTASVYLSALTHVGLITQRRNGTQLLYSVNLQAAGDVVSGIFQDCCGGRADLCPPEFSAQAKMSARTENTKFNVLFVCTGNSARSILAEAILRDIAGDRFVAYSAGIAQRSELNPFAVEMLRGKGLEVAPLRSKSITEFRGADAPKMDFVFTVCDLAANEDCPVWTGQPLSGHWGLPDPVKVTGSDAQKRLAFQQTYGALYNRINSFTALPFEALSRRALQLEIDEIGRDAGKLGMTP